MIKCWSICQLGWSGWRSLLAATVNATAAGTADATVSTAATAAKAAATSAVVKQDEQKLVHLSAW